ncbi:hypothetical protein DFJ74DRAFT_694406 [Hyaloraphidium curvatum]|nr:hypothetical protein DFJ74DRAFT_694406 [Hyaloraphidium curvatum]
MQRGSGRRNHPRAGTANVCGVTIAFLSPILSLFEDKPARVARLPRPSPAASPEPRSQIRPSSQVYNGENANMVRLRRAPRAPNAAARADPTHSPAQVNAPCRAAPDPQSQSPAPLGGRSPPFRRRVPFLRIRERPPDVRVRVPRQPRLLVPLPLPFLELLLLLIRFLLRPPFLPRPRIGMRHRRCPGRQHHPHRPRAEVAAHDPRARREPREGERFPGRGGGGSRGAGRERVRGRWAG